ncbi:hypothetical protein HDU97_006547 [Phlyctochytrium planicorne]|nr:hypothetical protein HDU97_006547 [Phlyctochytrium planicorne]
MPLSRLSRLPLETLTDVLKFTEDWKISLIIECIASSLPDSFPDAGAALDAIVIASVLPASTAIIRRHKNLADVNKDVEDVNTLLETAFVLKTFNNLNLIRTILKSGTANLKMVTYVHKRIGPSIFRIDTFENYIPKGTFMDLAANMGELKVVEYLHEHRLCRPTIHAMNFAAKEGHIEVVKWLDENTKAGCTTDAMDGAALCGHLDVVVYLNENRSEGCTLNAIDWEDAYDDEDADDDADDDSDEVADYILNHRPAWFTIRGVEAAIDGNNWDMFIRLLDGNFETLSPDLMDLAACLGRLNMIQYLHHNRRDGCTTFAMDDAAMKGHLDVVQFLHFNRSEGCTKRAMNMAACNGHLDLVAFLHENRDEGCTTHAMDWASKYGHLSVVKYLHERRQEGCTTDALDWAARNGHLEIVKFLHLKRTEGCTVQAADWAAINRHDSVAMYLVENCVKGCVQALEPTRSDFVLRGFLTSLFHDLFNNPDDYILIPANPES